MLEVPITAKILPLVLAGWMMMGNIIQFPHQIEIWHHPNYPRGWVVIEKPNKSDYVRIIVETIDGELQITDTSTYTDESPPRKIQINDKPQITKIRDKWHKKVYEHIDETFEELINNQKEVK